MRRSFSVEDLLGEVEKICYDASGTSKVRNKFTPLNLHGHIAAHMRSAADTVKLYYVHGHILRSLTVLTFNYF